MAARPFALRPSTSDGASRPGCPRLPTLPSTCPQASFTRTLLPLLPQAAPTSLPCRTSKLRAVREGNEAPSQRLFELRVGTGDGLILPPCATDNAPKCRSPSVGRPSPRNAVQGRQQDRCSPNEQSLGRADERAPSHRLKQPADTLPVPPARTAWTLQRVGAAQLL